MRVSELREAIEYLDGDMEVRLMSQPSWPFEYSVRDVICGLDLGEEDEGYDPEGDDPEEEGPRENIVYLVEGAQICYGTKAAWGR